MPFSSVPMPGILDAAAGSHAAYPAARGA
jgi:hypothetical protein